MRLKPFLLAAFAQGLFICKLGAAGVEIDVTKLPPAAIEESNFAKDVQPIFEKSCVHCHGPQRPKGHFRVDSREALIKGGESGQPGVVPGNSAASALVHNVAGLVKEMEMPPLEKRDKYPALTTREVALLRAWIDQGAKWPDGLILAGSAVTPMSEEPRQAAAAGQTAHPLFDQIRRGDHQAIAKALGDHSLMNLRDEHGNTPLIQAAFYLDASQVARFLDAGADPNAANMVGVTALMKAVSDVDKVRLLLQRHANVNAVSLEKNTALIIACYSYGAGKVVRQLLDHGADVQAENHMGGNAIMAAAETGDLDVLRMLLDRKGDPNSTERIVESNSRLSALMIASQLGHLDCVKLLLQRGADVNLTTEHGSALHCAVFTDRRDVVRLLLDHGADVNVPGRRLASFRHDLGFTPIMYAALNEANDPTVVQWLLARGAKVNAKSSSGDTALHFARLRGETKIVAALVAAGADSNEPENGISPPGPRWSAEQIATLDPVMLRHAAEGGVSLLLKSSAQFTEATGNRCFTCHQHSQPALAWSLARERGLNYPDDLANTELAAAIRAAKRRTDSAIQEPMPVPSIAAWFLVGLNATGYHADTLTDDFAYSLARYQYGDGRWITKAARAPTDYSDVTTTALAIRALTAYAPPTMKAAFDQKIAKASRWLRSHHAQSTEERAMQLLGLVWSGDHSSELSRLAKALLQEQRADGGWAQLPTLASDAYATGLSLYALHQSEALKGSDPAYQLGVKFLLKNQCDDGSWLVHTRASPVQVAIDGVFSHGKDQWISSSATSWSTMALMLASEPAPASKRAAIHGQNLR